MAKTIDQIADNLYGERESLTKDEFVKLVGERGMKLADLSDGDFVMKAKYETLNTKYVNLTKDYENLKNNPDIDEATKKRIADLEKERDTFRTQYEEVNAAVIKSERLSSLKKLGFKDEFQDFCRTEIEKNISDTVDFDTAAKKYLKEHTQYLEEGNGRTGSRSGLSLARETTKQGGVFSDLNSFLRGE